MCVFAPRGDLRSFRACHSPRRRAPRAPPPRHPNPQPITRCGSTLGQVCCAVLEIFRADGHRLSGWNSSTIDPKHARKRRHHHSRAGCNAAFARRHAHRGHLAQHVGVPRRGLRRPLEQPQPSPRGGSVAYSPGPERGQPRAPLVGAIGGTWDVVTGLDAHSVFLAWLGQSAMLRCLESSGRCRPFALVLVGLKWPWIVLLNM